MSPDAKLHTPTNRRRALRMLSAVGAMPLVARSSDLLAADASPRTSGASLACVLSPELTEGPFFVDERLHRADLTSATSAAGVVDGLPLVLKIYLQNVAGKTCGPLAGVQIDVWHASALGRYSDERAGMGQANTRGQKWLRGFQVSDNNGQASFNTIYPGFYPGRTAHIHIKARLFDAGGNASYEFNSQLFFDEAINDKVFALPAYNAQGRRDVRNAQDDIYGGDASLLVDVTPLANHAAGYVASAALGLDLGKPRRASSSRGDRPPGMGRRPGARAGDDASSPIAKPGIVTL